MTTQDQSTINALLTLLKDPGMLAKVQASSNPSMNQAAHVTSNVTNQRVQGLDVM